MGNRNAESEGDEEYHHQFVENNFERDEFDESVIVEPATDGCMFHKTYTRIEYSEMS